MVMLQSGPFCAEVVRDTNILRPELIFLKKFLPFILWAVFQKRTIYNGISMIYTVLFLKKQTSFYGWRHRYKLFHLSPFHTSDAKSITTDMEFSQTVHTFCNKKLLFSNFGKQTSVSQIKKKKLPLSALPYPSPLQR